jgi:Ca2+-binding RTX toxin-like protein
MANPPISETPSDTSVSGKAGASSELPVSLAQAVAQAAPGTVVPPISGGGGGDLAQASNISVGLVKGTTGDTVITRVDGSIVQAGPGTPVFRGDILATREDASVSISFANNAEFFLGERGRMLVESIAPAQADQEPQSVYFVLHGPFGFSHRSESFSGAAGAVVRTPVATLQVHNGRVAGRAAAEAVENVFTLLKNADNSLGFTRVVTAGAAIMLQSEGQTAQVVSLFREPVIIDKPDFASFVDIFGIAVAQWVDSPAIAPAAGGEGGEAPTLPGEVVPDVGPGARYLPPAEGVVGTAPQIAELDGGFVALPPRLGEVREEGNPNFNPEEGLSAPVAPVDSGPPEFIFVPGEILFLDGGAGLNDIVNIAAPTDPGGNIVNISITDVGGRVELDLGSNTKISLGGFETLDLGLGDSGNSLTIGDLTGTDITNNTVKVAGGAGDDVIDASAAGRRSVLTGGDGEDTLTGGSQNDELDGGAGNDTLDGGVGSDKLTGGAGNDIFVVDNVGDTVIELAGEGTDTVQSSITFDLSTNGANVENLTLTGVGNINGTGNSGANILTGNSGNNTLDGGTGVDTLIGGQGNDIYVVDETTETVTEQLNEGTDTVQSSASSFTLSANVENLTLLAGGGANAGIGNDLVNTLTGNGFDNTLTGLGGNDTLDGQGGLDTLIGGLGDDSYVVDQTTDVVTEQLNEGTDTVQSSASSYTLSANVENLTLTGVGNINGTGNTLANTLTGNSGVNTLDGGTGIDTLVGGLGNDIYVVDETTETVTEQLNEGTDTVQSSASSFTLSANVENLTLLVGAGRMRVSATIWSIR